MGQNAKKIGYNILFSPCHYIYDGTSYGGELSWAFNIAHGVILSQNRGEVITGFAATKTSMYPIAEVQPKKHKLDLGLKNAIAFNIKYSRATSKRLKKGDIDVLHHVLPFAIDRTFSFVMLRGRIKTIKIVGPIQTPLYTNENSLGLVNRFVQKLSTKTLLSADKIVTIHDQGKKMLISRGVHESKIKVIPPGIDISQFGYQQHKKRGGALRIVTVSFLQKRKNIDQLLNAMDILNKRGLTFNLTVIGDGPELSSLKVLTTKLNLNERVEFVGAVANDQVAQYYQKNDLFISMSDAESWGQVFLEAMACGLPIVASRNIGSTSILGEDSKFGILIERDDVEDLAKKVEFLMCDATKLQNMSINARQEAVSKYDWAKIIDRYIKLYDELLSDNTCHA